MNIPISGIEARIDAIQQRIATLTGEQSQPAIAPAPGTAQNNGAFSEALAGASSVGGDNPPDAPPVSAFGVGQLGPDGSPVRPLDPSEATGSKVADFAPQIGAAAAKYGVDPKIVSAVMQVESGGDPNAVSRAGAQGLMQLMPSTARAAGVNDPFDPAQSIDGGTREIASLLSEFGGDLDLALAGYNAGSGAVKRFGGIPPYPETQSYVRKIRGILANS